MKVFKLIRIAGIAAAAVALTSGVSAQTLLNSANVSVSVSLTSQCKLSAAAPTLAVDFGTYTAFGAATTPNPSMTFDVLCTRGFGGSPTITWDANAGAGVISGLAYSLSLANSATVPGTAATATVGATPATLTFKLSGTMASGQAGDNAGAGPQTATRTVTLTF
jgi:hypothetical protein